MKIKIPDVQSYIERKAEFSAGGNMDAKKFGDFYIVYSYTTPIAIFSFDKKEWRIDMRTYSMTTSRHRNLVIKAAEAEVDEIITKINEDIVL